MTHTAHFRSHLAQVLDRSRISGTFATHLSLRFPTLVASLSIATLAIACGAPSEESITSDNALNEAWTPHRPADPASCNEPVAGKLNIYMIPPSTALDWSTPNKLINTAIRSEISESILTGLGQAQLTHSIGHVNVELECGEDSIPLTGQTGDTVSWKAAVDGFGLLLRSFPGHLNDQPEGGRDDMREDIRLRTENGLLAKMSFLVNANTCRRVKSFYKAYEESGAYKRYGGDFRSRRFEGGGCAIFGADVVDVSGMLRRSQFTPLWAQSVVAGSKRIANAFSGEGYPTGSNLVAPGPDGKSLFWTGGETIAASKWPILMGTEKLKVWSDDSDEFKVPFTIYDPMLMHDWAQKVWNEATANGSAQALETTWKASTEGRAHVVTTDAHCTQPQTIPFASDNDDLFKDSDQP
jgi:hypothetical protein